MKHRLVYNLLLLTLATLVTSMFLLMAPASAADQHLGDSSIVSERDLPSTSGGRGTGPQEGVSLEKIPLAGKGLGLKLVGTVVADDPRNSVAIIDNRSTRKQEVYHEGDRIGQALIKKILRNKVIIETRRGEELLAMGLEESPRTSLVSQQALRRQPQEATGGTVRFDPEEVEPANTGHSEFMQQIRIRPHLQEGQLGGLLIYRIEPDSIFAMMGLEEGDVIVTLNGEAITSIQQATEFYDALEEGGEVILEVKRGEDIQELRIEVQ